MNKGLLNKKRILVVEDYEPNVLVTRTHLEDMGYEVRVALSGAEAIDLFTSCSFDAVLMDVQMPVMDGLEAAKRIRALEKSKSLPAVPIIAMTGRATKDDELFCRRAGMNACLSKPYRQDELAGILKDLVA